MKTLISKSVALGLFAAMFLFSQVIPASEAQNRRGRSRTTTTRPTPAPSPVPTPTPTQTTTRVPKQPVRLALLNGQLITTADIDREVGAQVEDLEERVAEASMRVLEMAINTLLLDHEARKRRINAQQLYDAEVTRRIAEPTQAQIAKVLEENRAQLQGEDPASARSQVIAFLKAQQEAKLSDDLVRRLRTTVPVVMGANLSTPNLAPATVVATVGGVSLPFGQLSERLKPILYDLRLRTYLQTKDALDRTITDLLLIAEANRRNVPPEEIVRSEVTSKMRLPTEAEIAKFYTENKSRIQGDLNSVRNELANYLQEEEQQRLEGLMAERLRRDAEVKLLITEPEAPRQAISVDDDPARGSATAPVTIVEFTDFQCPACAAMHPVLEEVLSGFGAKVRFVVRDFPLRSHQNAFKAAEAANAAHAQGKFFEYVALLFQRQNALDVGSLKKYASELGLDRVRFDAALDKGTYGVEVRMDIKDGELYGVESTPTIFINGVRLRTLSAEALREAIDRALATPQSTTR
ncbi:MAG TPA: thioredoxin domain-containing protein [Pyrinomonadaceae bacterium]|nr:thioredoxin domain-containing protein [Pyrinomonadaceae bacterium]